MRKKYLAIIKDVFKFGMLLMIALAVFNMGRLYGEFKDPGDSIINFYTKQTSYSWDPRTAPPKEFLGQMAIVGYVNNYVYLALLFQALIYLVDYWLDRENHFITLIKNRLPIWIEKINKNMESEDK